MPIQFPIIKTIQNFKNHIQKQQIPNNFTCKKFECTKDCFIPQTPEEIKQKTIDNEKTYANFLDKKGRVTKEEYEFILKNYPFIIDKCRSELDYNGILSQPIGIASIGVNFKEYFDSTQKNPNGYRLI